jgi:hypothetical protein
MALALRGSARTLIIVSSRKARTVRAVGRAAACCAG